MSHEHLKEEKKLLRIFAKNERAVVGKDSALDSVIAVYGTVITASEMRDCEVEICVNKDASVEVMNTYENTKMLFWDNEYIDEPGSIFLLYVLSEKAEFLLYWPSELDHKFWLSSVPKRNPSTGEILCKVESLPHFKAYTEIQRLICGLVNHPYKNKYIFSFNRSIEEDYLYG